MFEKLALAIKEIVRRSSNSFFSFFILITMELCWSKIKTSLTPTDLYECAVHCACLFFHSFSFLSVGVGLFWLSFRLFIHIHAVVFRLIAYNFCTFIFFSLHNLYMLTYSTYLYRIVVVLLLSTPEHVQMSDILVFIIEKVIINEGFFCLPHSDAICSRKVHTVSACS